MLKQARTEAAESKGEIIVVIVGSYYEPPPQNGDRTNRLTLTPALSPLRGEGEERDIVCFLPHSSSDLLIDNSGLWRCAL